MPIFSGRRKYKKSRFYPAFLYGGADRDRTDGLGVANAALSQLSYCPVYLMELDFT